MVDQQLDLDVDPLPWAWPGKVRLPQRGPRDRERVDRIRLPASTSRAPLRHRQLRRHPHQLLAEPK